LNSFKSLVLVSGLVIQALTSDMCSCTLNLDDDDVGRTQGFILVQTVGALRPM